MRFKKYLELDETYLSRWTYAEIDKYAREQEKKEKETKAEKSANKRKKAQARSNKKRKNQQGPRPMKKYGK